MPDTLEQLFKLYRESFPANECRTETDLRSALKTPAYQLLTKLDGADLLGFAILFVPSNKSFALLEYIAVRPCRRNAGIGGELLAQAIKQTDGRLLLTEVETESSGPAALRRQQFYRRKGFVRVDGLRYQLPLPGNPPPMELWIHSPPTVPIDRHEIALWISTIYTDVYHCEPQDPRIAQMFDQPSK